MIAVVEDVLGGGTAFDLQAAESGVVAAMVTLPAEAAEAFSALVAVSYKLGRLERIALTAIVRRKSAARIRPLLERHAQLVETQHALARTVAVILHGFGQPATFPGQ